MSRWRCWALVVLLFAGIDFLDPSPGIFFLDHDRLFVAGVAEVKPAFPPPAIHHAPPDLGVPAVTVERLTATGQLDVVAGRARPGRWDTGRKAMAVRPSSTSPDDH